MNGVRRGVWVGFAAAVAAGLLGGSGPSTDVRRGDAARAPEGLTSGEWTSILKQVRVAEYDISAAERDEPGVFRAQNRAKGLTARLSPGRMELTPPRGQGVEVRPAA